MAEEEKLNILAIEPYLTGSHRSFLSGLARHSRCRLDVRGLPGRKWKWRMRASAINFAEDVQELGEPPDIFLLSDFLDVAAFKALVSEPFRRVPFLTYFHENQLTYPVEDEAERDYQFVFTNLTSCLASDRVYFNSRYHMEEFLGALPGFLRRMPDQVPEGLPENIRAKSKVLHLGIEPDLQCEPERPQPPKAKTIVWNHRWEYDKNPDLFFRALFRLSDRGVPFRLVVLGEQFRQSPPIFEQAREKLADHIDHFGFAESRADYWRWLQRGDLLVSTSIHEFFGLSVLEGIAAGCFPLLPYRLAYPELLPPGLHGDCFFLSDDDFESRLEYLLTHPLPDQQVRLQATASHFHWQERAKEFDEEFSDCRREKNP